MDFFFKLSVKEFLVLCLLEGTICRLDTAVADDSYGTQHFGTIAAKSIFISYSV